MDKNRYFQIWSGKYIKTKVADIQRLCSKWLWLVMAVYKPSFAVCNNQFDIMKCWIRYNFFFYIMQHLHIVINHFKKVTS